MGEEERVVITSLGRHSTFLERNLKYFTQSTSLQSKAPLRFKNKELGKVSDIFQYYSDINGSDWAIQKRINIIMGSNKILRITEIVLSRYSTSSLPTTHPPR